MRGADARIDLGRGIARRRRRVAPGRTQRMRLGVERDRIEIERARREQQVVVLERLREDETLHAVGPRVPNLVAGPDVIVGEIESVDEFGNTQTQVGLAVGTDSCNNGDHPVDWFQLPNTDHPVVPQNLYRMSGGATNDERFEQIGQSCG